MQSTYHICNLSCPNCADKIEKAIQKELKVDAVTINLVSGKITLEHQQPLVEDFMQQASSIALSIEDGVFLTEIPANESCSPHDNPVEHPISLQDKILLGSAAILFCAGILIPNESLAFGVFILAYLLAGKNVFIHTARNIAKGKILDENVLMLLASIGAFLIGAFAEGTITMILYVTGEYIQDYSIYRSQKSISDLMNLKPQTAVIWTDSGTEIVAPEAVKIGDILLVSPGEKIALDGIVLEGSSYLDNSALTGESVPILCKAGDEVLSGGLVKDGVLKVKVTKHYSDSTIAKILEMIAGAAGRKANSERMLTRFAAYYTPTVVLLAALLTLIPVLFLHGELRVWGYRSLVFLAASCPCALIISIPLTYFAGLGKASRHGILIKGANYLEALAYLDTIVFDKTGTLTKGNFEVVAITPATSYTEMDVLTAAALAEKYSNHPIALSVKRAYGKPLPDIPAASYKDIGGFGITMEYNGHQYLCGNLALMQKSRIQAVAEHTHHTTIYVARDGSLLGSIAIADQMKEETASSIQDLKDMGISHIKMFTGDRPDIADFVGKEVGIKEIYAGMLPTDKYTKLTELLSPERKVAFVGDGINDASVIKAADIGIAMGNLGSDIAVESADIILSNDKLSALVEAIRISKRTASILKQNLILSLGFKLLILVLGAVGIAGMWLAIFADVGIMLIASANALRAGR